MKTEDGVALLLKKEYVRRTYVVGGQSLHVGKKSDLSKDGNWNSNPSKPKQRAVQALVE